MLLSRIADRMPVWFATQATYTLIGASGMGKTAMVMQAPEIIKRTTGREIGVVVFNAATYTPMHLLGFGVVKHHEEFSEMLFSLPFFWRTQEGKRLDEYPGGGIIFVDEYDKGDPDVMKNLGEMGYSKRIGTHFLPPNWVVWMAGNPFDARFGSKKQLDYLINRQTTIQVKHDPEGWEEWAVRNRLLPETLAFARNNKAVVFNDKLPEKQGPWCTPRSLAALDRQLQEGMAISGSRVPIQSEDALEEAEGTIGSAAQPYFTQLKTALGMPDLAEVLKDPATCRLPNTDCMALFCYKAAFAATPANIGKIIQYIDRLPKEFSHTFMKAAVNRNAKLITNDDVGKWAQGNAQLLMLLNRYSNT